MAVDTIAGHGACAGCRPTRRGHPMAFRAVHEQWWTVFAHLPDLSCERAWTDVLRVRPAAPLVCAECQHRVRAKVSPTGLRFFAHAPGAPECAAAGESIAHHPGSCSARAIRWNRCPRSGQPRSMSARRRPTGRNGITGNKNDGRQSGGALPRRLRPDSGSRCWKAAKPPHPASRSRSNQTLSEAVPERGNRRSGRIAAQAEGSHW
jgi:hypothetical protein